jgi:hypothetical protein
MDFQGQAWAGKRRKQACLCAVSSADMSSSDCLQVVAALKLL